MNENLARSAFSPKPKLKLLGLMGFQHRNYLLKRKLFADLSLFIISKPIHLNCLQRFINRSKPQLSKEQQQNLTRWAVSSSNIELLFSLAFWYKIITLRRIIINEHSNNITLQLFKSVCGVNDLAASFLPWCLCASDSHCFHVINKTTLLWGN